jgi:hypothetical protein
MICIAKEEKTMLANLESRLQLVREAQAFPPMLLERLARWIESADEQELYRINPLLWAADNHVDENVVIDLFLYATDAGIFELVWSVLCTQCGVLINTPGGLRSFSRVQRICRL